MNLSTIPDHGESREQIVFECIDRALRTVRQFLGLDIAFVSRFDARTRTIRHLDQKPDRSPLHVGQSLPLSDGLCLDVVEGRLPEVIPDTSANPLAADKAKAACFPIGAQISVSIPLSGGGIYGTLCCVNRSPMPQLGARDLEVMKAVAQLMGSHLDSLLAGGRERDVRRLVIEGALSLGMPEIAYQPITDFSSGEVVAAEALSRFTVEPLRTPDKWFADAADVGMELELSKVAIRRSLEGFKDGFAAGMILGVNMSPKLICQLDLNSVFDGFPLDRIAVEITEHDIVEDYEELLSVLGPLRKRGMRVSIDDMGAGYSNIKHVLKMKPDCIKLDASLIQGIDRDPMKQAWIAGIMEFSNRVGCAVLAEGIEREEELDLLRELGVGFGQGFLLGRPGPVERVLGPA